MWEPRRLTTLWASTACYRDIASLTHGAEPFLRSRQLCSYSRTSHHCMKPESSLPCSQEPSAGPYPEPEQSNPIQSIPSHPISLRSVLILSTHLRHGLPSGLFLLVFPPISYMHASSHPFVLHVLSISSMT
jgi:hypothetical protein